MKKAWSSKTNKKNGKRFNNHDYELRHLLFCSIWQIKLLFYYWVSKIVKSNVLGSFIGNFPKSRAYIFQKSKN